MKMYARAKRNGNNGGRPRGLCECSHKDAQKTFERIFPKSPRQPGFIGYTDLGGNAPKLKTSPRWCPLRFSSLERKGGGGNED